MAAARPEWRLPGWSGRRGFARAMTLVTGVDIIEIERVRRVAREYGERFARRIYTEGEIAFCRDARRSSRGDSLPKRR